MPTLHCAERAGAGEADPAGREHGELPFALEQAPGILVFSLSEKDGRKGLFSERQQDLPTPSGRDKRGVVATRTAGRTEPAVDGS